ncbi:MAG: hypothetical protein FD143_1935 [Ignavibacteria bacterium]|nr:MAG: hypothetical protein FD143_1935 [Ignavibacteria bacterium]KAF0159910.1 MAG: hypothetical protein FD188_2035 [Ignavibacteria bacterium]
MKITAQDRGKYLRGMLLLMDKDKQILDHEKSWFFKLSKILGYDIEFCRTALHELPENVYLENSPPKFSNSEIAKAFIVDGIHLAYADRQMTPNELLWINSVAETNGVDILWGIQEFEKFRHQKYAETDVYKFEIEKLFEKDF